MCFPTKSLSSAWNLLYFNEKSLCTSFFLQIYSGLYFKLAGGSVRSSKSYLAAVDIESIPFDAQIEYAGCLGYTCMRKAINIEFKLG
jgi:hypothetical protein